MLKRWIGWIVLCCLLWLSGCATGSSSSGSSYEYTPNYPYSQKEVCGWGAVYCGPGP